MSPRRLVRPILAVLALFAALPAAAEPKEYTITMGNMTYGKIPDGIKVGDTILWINRDTAVHSATSRDHSFDIRTNPGQTVKMTVQKAGTFPFTCIYHSMMRGSLTVAP